jgi:ribosomal protein S18 acetylase RimI-like enzyme
MVSIQLVNTAAELVGIQQLQRKNLRKEIGEAEALSQGFLMAEFDMLFLNAMQAAAPAVIAKDHDEVVGYALVATQAVRDLHPLLADLFNQIDQLTFQGIALQSANYVVVGQLCVAKEYRGQGLVQRLYNYFRDSLQSNYQFGITDVAQANQRSLKAHIKTGFQVIHSIEYGGIGWDIVLWDWRGI